MGGSVESVQNIKIVLKCNYIYSLKISLNFWQIIMSKLNQILFSSFTPQQQFYCLVLLIYTFSFRKQFFNQYLIFVLKINSCDNTIIQLQHVY